MGLCVINSAVLCKLGTRTCPYGMEEKVWICFEILQFTMVASVPRVYKQILACIVFWRLCLQLEQGWQWKKVHRFHSSTNTNTRMIGL